MTETDVLLLRGEIPNLMLGSIFSFLGLAALAVAVFRRKREFLVLFWFGCFIGMYGVRLIAQATIALTTAHSSWPDRADVFVSYMLLVPGTLFWVELTVGRFRRFLACVSATGLMIGVVGLGYYAATGSRDKVTPLNNFLAIVLLLGVGVIVVTPKLSRRFLLVQSRMLTVCLPAIAIAALYYNLSGLLNFRPTRNIEPAGFAVWVFALGYIAAQRVFANERRLLAIESELETARQIQISILPRAIPALPHLRIAAAYEPMSAVAGDFYQFIPVDQHRLGVLVADVCGHGVPAAMISSMIKVAMQSVAGCAADPSRVLIELNRILSPELRGQLISAAYLWIDTEHHCARYSAAGHPPLLYWRSSAGKLQRVESNGLLFGIAADEEYPVHNFALQPQDRLLLYTDGVTEPESVTGESFGDRQLNEIVQAHHSRPASELLDTVLSQLHSWPPMSANQQDDITLIVIDVL